MKIVQLKERLNFIVKTVLKIYVENAKMDMIKLMK